MPYGSSSKSDNVSYTSSATGSVTRTFSGSITKESFSRSGQNGIYTYRKTSYMNLRIPTIVYAFAGYRTVYRRRKQIIGYRTIVGKPIKRTKVVRVGASRSRQTVIIGHKPARVKAIYRWVSVAKKKKIFVKKLVYRSKRIVLPAIMLKDLAPHPLTFESVKRTGHDSGISISCSNLLDPSKNGTTILTGCLSGVHAGGSRPFGVYNNTSGVPFQNFFGNPGVEKPILDEALFRLYSNARSGVANFTNILAEAQGLRRTVLDYTVGVARALLSGKARFLSSAVATLSDRKKISQQYLSYIYGLSPAIDDFNATIHELNTAQDTWRKYVGRSSKEWETTESFNQGIYRHTLVRTYQIKCKYQCIITGNSTMPTIPNHQSSNFGLAAWEIIPWSFAIDWLLPIGKWLEGSDLFSGVTIKYAHRSILYKETYKLTVTHGGDLAGWRYSSASQTFTGELIKFRREITPIPAMPFPRAKNPFSTRHVLNGLFLLISRLR